MSPLLPASPGHAPGAAAGTEPMRPESPGPRMRLWQVMCVPPPQLKGAPTRLLLPPHCAGLPQRCPPPAPCPGVTSCPAFWLWMGTGTPARAHLGKKVIDDGVIQHGAGAVVQQLEAMRLPQSAPVGEEEPGGGEGQGSGPRPARHSPYQPAESPQGPRPRRPYLILYTTTWLRASSTVKRWLGGYQQLRSSVARAKRGWQTGSTPGDGQSGAVPGAVTARGRCQAGGHGAGAHRRLWRRGRRAPRPCTRRR